MSHRIPGPLTERLGAIAARSKRWLQPGSIYERSGRNTYNTALLFAPNGELVLRYRKLFPWMPFETSTPGTDPPGVASIPRVGTVGLMICYDGWFPEVARGLALAGAEAILAPTMTSSMLPVCWPTTLQKGSAWSPVTSWALTAISAR